MGRRGRIGRRGSAALTIAVVGLGAGPAAAAEVSVEQSGQPGFVPQSFRLQLVAAPGEPNAVGVTLVGTTAATATYSVRDLATAPTPGAGCTSGDVDQVLCTLGRSRPPSGCIRGFCSDAGARVLVDVAAGDGDDLIDLASLPEGDGGGGQLTTRVDAGSGDDAVGGSPTSDEVEPGPGADSVTTGEEADLVIARSGGSDGPDVIDLGAGDYDAVSYAAATDAVTVTIDGNPDDGAPGEGDNVAGAEVVDGGAGDDLIVASSAGSPTGFVFAQLLNGNAGADRIVGGPGPDAIQGGALVGVDAGDVIEAGGGDDFVQGAAGNDLVALGRGDDKVDAGVGADRIDGAAGHDLIAGESGRDRITGGVGEDLLLGGAGGDLLRAADGAHDRLDCGGGDDRSRVDRHDTSRNCER